jgi:hypothetical protein
MNDVTSSRFTRIRTLLRPDVVGWWLTGIILAGAILRFAGITWGLPLTLHADEWAIVNNAIDMAARNSFEPSFYMRPDHLEIKLSYLAYEVVSRVVYGEPPEAVFARSITPFHTISRAITAAFGTAMIPLAYLVMKRFGRVTGLTAAFLIAFFPPFIEHSHYASPDIPIAFTMLLVVYASLRYLENPSWGNLALASAAVALGVTAKYPAVISAVAVAYVVVLAAMRRRRWIELATRGMGAIAIFFLALFVISPTLFTNASEVMAQLLAQNSDGHLGADGLDWGGNLAFYSGFFANEGGAVLTLVLCIGVARVLVRREWDALPLFSGIVFWVGISALQLHWARWGLPAYTSALLIAALGIAWCGKLLAAARSSRSARRGVTLWLSGLLAAVGAVNLLTASVAESAVFVTRDTREASLEYVTRHGITADAVHYDAYSPFKPSNPKTIASEVTLSGEELTTVPGVDRKPYILTSSGMADRYLSSRPESLEADVYRRVSELPVVQRWTAQDAPTATWWDVPRIVDSVAFIGYAARGGMTGPAITLYTWPDS